MTTKKIGSGEVAASSPSLCPKPLEKEMNMTKLTIGIAVSATNIGDLIPAPVAAENVYSTDLRIHPVDGDGMEPGLRAGRDFVLVAPVTEFSVDGIYLLDVGGPLRLYRTQSSFNGTVVLMLDNPKYELRNFVDVDDFNASVVGFVCADVIVRDERFLREAQK